MRERPIPNPPPRGGGGAGSRPPSSSRPPRPAGASGPGPSSYAPSGDRPPRSPGQGPAGPRPFNPDRPPRPPGSGGGYGGPRPAGSGGYGASRPSGPRPDRPYRPGPRLTGYVKPQDDDGTRVNDMITSQRIRLINETGEMIGVVSINEGLSMAEEAGLDLVEISPNADPPVCKILDYGKFRYEQQKKAAEARKKQKIVELKELKIRPRIDDHDYDTKMKHAKSFLEEGNKVKFTMRFRGREMENKVMINDLWTRIKTDLQGLGKVEMEPKTEGRQAIMIVASEKK